MSSADGVRAQESTSTSLAYAGVAIASALIFFAGYGFALSQQGVSAGSSVTQTERLGAAASRGAMPVDLLGRQLVPADSGAAVAEVQRVVLEVSGNSVPLLTVRAGVPIEILIMSPMHGMPGWVGLAPHSVSQPIADGTVVLPALEPGAYTLFGDGPAPLAQVVAR
jgi:hypothetical protein